MGTVPFFPGGLAEPLPHAVPSGRGAGTRLHRAVARRSPRLCPCVSGHAPRLAWWIASVNRPAATRLIDWLHEHRPADHVVLLACGDLPLEVRVEAPRHGRHRPLVDAVAVNRLRDPARPAVIVDVGTAITVDLVSADGAFLGRLDPARHSDGRPGAAPLHRSASVAECLELDDAAARLGHVNRIGHAGRPVLGRRRSDTATHRTNGQDGCRLGWQLNCRPNECC